MKLWRITSNFFCAGIVTKNSGFVVQSAPILKRFLNSHFDPVSYARATGYSVEIVRPAVHGRFHDDRHPSSSKRQTSLPGTQLDQTKSEDYRLTVESAPPLVTQAAGMTKLTTPRLRE